MNIEQLSSAIQGNIISGLKGADANLSITLLQIEDEIIQERMQVIKEYSMKNMIPARDLLYSIPCVKVDCADIERCCCHGYTADKIKHIQIPQVYNDFGEEAIDFIGSVDRQVRYKVYTDDSYRFNKYRRRGNDKPFVWIDTTPNKNNMNDAFIFEASPSLQQLLVVMIPKDPRQLADYTCCDSTLVSNITYINTEIEKRVTEKLIRWYRQMAIPPTPDDQVIKA